eukprot:GFYU01002674.1.p1 GENE.GFYU01002674.1~~GFYU01002674.1.p1  ORF type:complete len:378 (-),score=47.76 GFYU01002674.1:94-1227(-)
MSTPTKPPPLPLYKLHSPGGNGNDKPVSPPNTLQRKKNRWRKLRHVGLTPTLTPASPSLANAPTGPAGSTQSGRKDLYSQSTFASSNTFTSPKPSTLSSYTPRRSPYPTPRQAELRRRTTQSHTTLNILLSKLATSGIEVPADIRAKLRSQLHSLNVEVAADNNSMRTIPCGPGAIPTTPSMRNACNMMGSVGGTISPVPGACGVGLDELSKERVDGVIHELERKLQRLKYEESENMSRSIEMQITDIQNFQKMEFQNTVNQLNEANKRLCSQEKEIDMLRQQVATQKEENMTLRSRLAETKKVEEDAGAEAANVREVLNTTLRVLEENMSKWDLEREEIIAESAEEKQGLYDRIRELEIELEYTNKVLRPLVAHMN